MFLSLFFWSTVISSISQCQSTRLEDYLSEPTCSCK
uniref:Uncharacterized protein n=1 Tax=Setaria viridis TaxID=4556 RepID=A0A4V6DC38_SETVI|nr:hypothetical protein SEVIR_2G430933v2 [Setaria viridis]